MLVLSRKESEAVVCRIDKNGLEELLEEVKRTGESAEIQLTVVRINGNRARLGLDAPRQVQFLRDEIAGSSSDPQKSTQA